MDHKLEQHPLGFWTVAKKPTQEELRNYYATKYYQEARGSYEIQYSEEEHNFFRAKLAQRHAVISRFAPSAHTMLDVGCGEGFALAYFREQGWTVKGLDFSSAGVESHNPNCLDSLHTGDVFDLLASEIQANHCYDVVWLQNVLEHVLDPVALLNTLKSLLTRDGIAVITVPNDYSIVQRAALELGHIDREFWVAIPDHLSYFDHLSFPATAQSTGWDCLELLGDFPIDWFLFHPASNYVNNKTAGKAAHRARVQLENLIQQQPEEAVLNFWSSAGRLGIGRDITGFLKVSRR